MFCASDICPSFATSFFAFVVCIVMRLWASNKHLSKINRHEKEFSHLLYVDGVILYDEYNFARRMKGWPFGINPAPESQFAEKNGYETSIDWHIRPEVDEGLLFLPRFKVARRTNAEETERRLLSFIFGARGREG